MADYTFAQLEQLIAQAGGSASQQQILAGIALGVESGGDPTAQNPTSTASGLWQELTTTWVGNGGANYAPTAAQASPLDQAIVAVNQSKNGYQPWAPDLGGSYYGGDTNPTTPAAGSPVANYLASIGAAGKQSYPPGKAAGTTSPTTSPSTAPSAQATGIAATKLTGAAAVLQDINDLMNPSGPSTLTTILTLGTAEIGPLIETFFVRGVFALGSIAIVYLGIKQFSSNTGGGPGLIEVVDKYTKNDLAQQRIDNQAAAREHSAEQQQRRAAQSAATNASREKVAATPRTRLGYSESYKESHVYHHSNQPTNEPIDVRPRPEPPKPPSKVKEVAAALAEGALLE